jgi:hypothetical protein
MLQKVPKKFVEKYWKGVPNPAVITLPNGVQQQLFWVKRGGDVLFKKNWEKIAKYLKFGFIVVFKYVGGSCLQLEIFGLNCLEIDYSKMIDQLKQEPEFVEMSDDEIHIASASQRRKRGKKICILMLIIKNIYKVSSLLLIIKTLMIWFCICQVKTLSYIIDLENTNAKTY